MSLHLDPNVLGAKKRRNDQHLTSTGKGHDFTNGYYFPPSLYRRTVPDVLPPAKQVPDHITWKNQVMKGYETTNGLYHDRKYQGGSPYSNPPHKKAAGHWNVHYLRDTYEKLQTTDSRRPPLTMGYQSSEMRAEFASKKAHPTLDSVKNPHQPFNLEQHHTGGNSQQVIASTLNPAMSGTPYLVPEKGTFKLNDIYLTTNNKTHRRWTKQELLDYPKKDNATYWECENYTKAWGHGSKVNPMVDDTKIWKKEKPMIDHLFFKSPTNPPPLPKIVPNVPHTGMETEKQGNYKVPQHLANKRNLYCEIDTPYITPVAGPGVIMKTPHMYKSEYMTYGSGRPVTVGT